MKVFSYELHNTKHLVIEFASGEFEYKYFYMWQDQDGVPDYEFSNDKLEAFGLCGKPSTNFRECFKEIDGSLSPDAQQLLEYAKAVVIARKNMTDMALKLFLNQPTTKAASETESSQGGRHGA